MRTTYFPQFLGAALLATITGISSLGHAAAYNLNHKNSSVTVDDALGIMSWSIDGASHLNYQTYFYRIGNVGGESLIQSLGAPTLNTFVNLSSQSQVDLTYASASLSVRSLVQLVGQNPGTGKANLNETITVQNLTAAPLELSFFQYSDFNLGGVAGGQSVQFIQNTLNSQYYRADQSFGSILLSSIINTANPIISHVEANLALVTLTSLTDGNPTTLNDATAAGVGDVTFAYQWDVTLAPWATFQLSKLTSIVPEPTTLTLFGLGLFGLALRRRKI